MTDDLLGRQEEPDNPDADERMFHACFSILGEFVEKELGTTSQGYDKEQSRLYRGYRLHSANDRDKAAIDLWLWYRDDLPEETALCDRNIAAMTSDNPVDHEQILQNLKDQKLRDLINIRRQLWI
jgi:hypothetical protein